MIHKYIIVIDYLVRTQLYTIYTTTVIRLDCGRFSIYSLTYNPDDVTGFFVQSSPCGQMSAGKVKSSVQIASYRTTLKSVSAKFPTVRDQQGLVRAETCQCV